MRRRQVVLIRMASGVGVSVPVCMCPCLCVCVGAYDIRCVRVWLPIFTKLHCRATVTMDEALMAADNYVDKSTPGCHIAYHDAGVCVCVCVCVCT